MPSSGAESSVDGWLIDRLQKGDEEAWHYLVSQYQGRLHAYAVSRVGCSDVAEDLVQEAFVSLIRSLGRFRGQCALQTFLFNLLRRRIVDQHRRRSPVTAMGHSAAMHAGPNHLEETWSVVEDPLGTLASEQDHFDRLRQAIDSVTGRLREERRFDDLLIAEGVFFAGMANRTVADLIGLQASTIASRKKRLLEQIRSEVLASGDDSQPASPAEDLLQRVWRVYRPSCPKRSVLGKYVLELLPNDWHQYVDKHVERLRCGFCRASVDEFQNVDEESDSQIRQDRLVRSTVNFLR